MDTRYQSHSERETADIAADLARRLPGGTVVLLFGDLGAGKTAFVRGFVEGAGIDPDEVSSPTFTIVQAYGGGRVQHVDLYRLGPAETDDLGLEELPETGALVCIEWADRLPRPVPGAVSVRILDRGGDLRELAIEIPPGLEGADHLADPRPAPPEAQKTRPSEPPAAASGNREGRGRHRTT